MKSEDEIRERLEIYRERAAEEVSGSASNRENQGKVNVLEWVLEE